MSRRAWISRPSSRMARKVSDSRMAKAPLPSTTQGVSSKSCHELASTTR
jgi:hypothetical protein